MKNKSFGKNLFTLIPLVFSGFLCIGLIFLFWEKINTEETFATLLREVAVIFIGLSTAIAIVIFSYIVFTVFTEKRSKNATNNQLMNLVKKMRKTQQIMEILLDSNLWLPGVREYIDDEFQGLTYFEVKEFYKGKSKLAIEYLQEKKNFNDTQTLYLELKSLLLQDPKQKKVTKPLTFPKNYKTEILEKWLEHKCGSGLWYYFGYKFGEFKESLDIEAIFERHQDKILILANEIDSEVFEDSSFNEIFLSKLGEHINKQIIPQLFQLQIERGQKTPKALKFLYILFSVFVLIGIITPLLILLLSMPPLGLAIAYAMVISAIFFAGTSLFGLFAENDEY